VTLKSGIKPVALTLVLAFLLIPVQAANQQANLLGGQIASQFASTENPVRYVTDSETGKGKALLGSIGETYQTANKVAALAEDTPEEVPLVKEAVTDIISEEQASAEDSAEDTPEEVPLVTEVVADIILEEQASADDSPEDTPADGPLVKEVVDDITEGTNFVNYSKGKSSRDRPSIYSYSSNDVADLILNAKVNYSQDRPSGDAKAPVDNTPAQGVSQEVYENAKNCWSKVDSASSEMSSEAPQHDPSLYSFARDVVSEFIGWITN